MDNDDSLTIKLPRDLMRWIRIRAAESEVSVSEYVRRTLLAERSRRAASTATKART